MKDPSLTSALRFVSIAVMVTSEPLNVAYYCSGHGLGHATRSIEVCKFLCEAGHSVTVVTSAPAGVFLREVPAARFTFRKAVLDTGAVQKDAFTVDQKSSLEQYNQTAVRHRETLLETEVAWLQATQTDLVVSDIVPLACAAARGAGLPCACVSNFSWDFIFSEYLTEVGGGSDFRRVVWQIAEDYCSAVKLLRLPGYVPMPAFREVVDVPLVVRRARKPREQVRSELGLSQGSHLAVFIYGGQPPGEWRLEASSLPPGWTCVVCSAGRPPQGVELPPNFLLAREDAYTPDLVAAADCVVGKIGYGTTSECLAHGVPLVFLRRDFFNEEPFLRKLLEVHDAAVEMKRRDFMAGHWAPYLERAQALNPTYREPTNGAEVVAQLLEQTAREWQQGQQGQQGQQQRQGPGSMERGGSARLRDTIVWGYCMQRHSARGKVDVPEWYTRGQLPAGPAPTPALAVVHEGQAEVRVDGFRVLEASCSLAAFPDTLSFLHLLSQLDEEPQQGQHELPERRAARGLFNWEEDVVVARAPGRLDVMGGIADYSGSLVLQMPTEEACHVAVQRLPPGKQRLWRHMERRQQQAQQQGQQEQQGQQGQRQGQQEPASFSGPHSPPSASTPSFSSSSSSTAAAPAGGGSPGAGAPLSRHPALRVVSFNADATNRGPTFDMDLSELKRDGRPLSYAEAREYFRSDPTTSWAAYVVGALVVLMHECGAHFSEGLSILVHSDVPEGKGVSSSAAVEVATMSALAAAHGIQLDRRRLALLCQLVENHVVGAPCGVMDQMASALGQAGRLLALRCQPAEVQGTVAIPPSLKFWGVDSGIRHSVGGSDYGAVRVGTFMGLRIISQLAADLAASRRSTPSPINDEAAAAAAGETGSAPPAPGQGPPPPQGQQQQQQRWQQGGGSEPEQTLQPVGGGYLANVAPSQFAASYELALPTDITGTDFLHQYGSHWDKATKVDPDLTYAVRTPAGHPIHENFRVHAFRQILLAHTEGSGLTGSPQSSPHSSPHSGSPGANSGPASTLALEQLETLGELMYQSHASYSRCGLGSEGTDRIVELVRQEHDSSIARGEEPALFGAKITGGGCGGTVCILGLANEAGEAAVRRVTQRYAEETGHQPKLFLGSSAGAAQFGHVRLRRRLQG